MTVPCPSARTAAIEASRRDEALAALARERELALELINSARRPLILAGHGIILSGALTQVREIAQENVRAAYADILWALLNSSEFALNH